MRKDLTDLIAIRDEARRPTEGWPWAEEARAEPPSWPWRKGNPSGAGLYLVHGGAETGQTRCDVAEWDPEWGWTGDLAVTHWMSLPAAPAAE